VELHLQIVREVFRKRLHRAFELRPVAEAHDVQLDPDYEYDNEKWSVPARHGYRLVFATWSKVTQRPNELIRELAAAFEAA
jgi:hypothetical protein